MIKKEVRVWLKSHEESVKSIEALRKELESKDLPTLLAMVEVSGVVLDRIKLLLIAEILHSRGILDQTIKG